VAVDALFAPEHEERRSTLLRFLMPGIVHRLNNDLFAIRGFAQVLGLDANALPRERSAILRAAGHATASVELLRVLGGSKPSGITLTREQPGVLLRQLGDLLRAPLRDRGAKVLVRHESVESPVHVEGALFSVAVAVIAHGIASVLPQGYRGEVELDLRHQDPCRVEVAFVIRSGRDVLPFPVDVAAAAARGAPLLAALHASAYVDASAIGGGSGEIRLELPVLAPVDRVGST
jgi:hypothetical protein